MRAGDKPAFPTSHQPGSSAAGLTKREHFAIEMMKANRRAGGVSRASALVAAQAIADADTLIAAMEKEA